VIALNFNPYGLEVYASDPALLAVIEEQVMNSNTFKKVLIQGDLSQLSESDCIAYYSRVCESLGLNPLTQPFAYIRLNGKLKLYALREATEQLQRLHLSLSRLNHRLPRGYAHPEIV
jgi:hypothetical protein